MQITHLSLSPFRDCFCVCINKQVRSYLCLFWLIVVAHAKRLYLVIHYYNQSQIIRSCLRLLFFVFEFWNRSSHVKCELNINWNDWIRHFSTSLRGLRVATIWNNTETRSWRRNRNNRRQCVISVSVSRSTWLQVDRHHLHACRHLPDNVDRQVYKSNVFNPPRSLSSTSGMYRASTRRNCKSPVGCCTPTRRSSTETGAVSMPLRTTPLVDQAQTECSSCEQLRAAREANLSYKLRLSVPDEWHLNSPRVVLDRDLPGGLRPTWGYLRCYSRAASEPLGKVQTDASIIARSLGTGFLTS